MTAQDWIFLFLYATGLAGFFLLIRRSGVSLVSVSVPSVLFWMALVFAFVGYPAIYFGWVPYYQRLGATEPGVVLKMVLLSTLAWGQLFLGICIGAGFFGKKAVAVDRGAGGHPILLGWGLLFGVCVAIFGLYLSRVGAIGLLEVLNGNFSAAELAAVRSDMTSGFAGKYWRYRIVTQGVLPFLALVAYAKFLLRKDTLWLLICLTAVGVTVFAQIVALEKAPLAFFLFQLLLVNLILSRGRMVFAKTAVYVVVAFGILVVMYWLFMGQRLAPEIALNPLRRLLTGQLIPFYFYLDLYPHVEEFAFGKTFPNPGGLLPFAHHDYAVTVFDWRVDAAPGVIGSAPTSFVGELWVNFGYASSLIFPAFIGFCVYFVHRLFCLGPLGPVGVALLAWAAVHISGLTRLGFSQFFFDVQALAVLAVAGLLWFYRRYRVEPRQSEGV